MVEALIAAVAAVTVLVMQRALERRNARETQEHHVRAVSRIATNNYWWAQRHIERLLNSEPIEVQDRLVLVELTLADWKGLAWDLDSEEWRAVALADSRLRMLSSWPIQRLATLDEETVVLLLSTYRSCERGRQALAAHARLQYERRLLRTPAALVVPAKFQTVVDALDPLT